MGDVVALEPWIDRRGLADYLGCSVRWLEDRQKDGIPHAILAGRIKYKVSRVEPWLEANGYLKVHEGEPGGQAEAVGGPDLPGPGR